jgi:RNA polymerase sigma-70 factor (ECF subfamily)
MSAKDIVQETFTKVWIKHEEVSFEKVKSYLFTTAYHAIVDWVRKEERNSDFEKVQHTAFTEFSISFDLQEILNEALDKLPEIQKTVVLLRDYEGYNYSEIAEITSLNESQVKVYIFRARKSLKEYIRKLDLVI